jgi:hypothetical protein
VSPDERAVALRQAKRLIAKYVNHIADRAEPPYPHPILRSIASCQAARLIDMRWHLPLTLDMPALLGCALPCSSPRLFSSE